ncbi:hypothetical protein HAX54_040258, partial [Datura stramonium]|nr:hypothetical protein [Datura stramonium]
HSGQWDENNRLVDYIMDEVVTNIDIDFNGFILLIATQLGVDIFINSLEIQYKIDVDSLLMMIRNNMGLRGWMYCRPVVAVDGSFLKASYRGTFLIASCQDAG